LQVRQLNNIAINQRDASHPRPAKQIRRRAPKRANPHDRNMRRLQRTLPRSTDARHQHLTVISRQLRMPQRAFI
jgi:hypothetical protein